MRPEHEVLLACMTSRLDEPGTERVRALARADLAWEIVVELALRHWVLPLVAWNIDAIGQVGVPAAIAARLREALRANAAWSLQQTGVLLDVTAALEDAGIECACWKGPALAWTAYGHLGLRTFSDLDLLIRAEHLDRARAVLGAMAIRPVMRKPAEREWTFARGDVVLELHWGPGPRLSAGLELEALRLESVTIGGTEVRQPAPADLLVTLAVHAGKHRWERLQWIADIAALLGSRRDLDWGRALDLAARTGNARALNLAIRLAHTLLDSPVPTGIADALDRDATSAHLARTVAAHLFVAPRRLQGLERAHLLWFQLGLRERVRDKLRYALAGAHAQARPPGAEWESREKGHPQIHGIHGMKD